MNGLEALARTLPTLLVIVGALLVLRHWARRGGIGSDAGVRVVTRTGIAKGTVVAVVAVGERRLLVGASEHGVNLLAELEPGTEPVAAATAVADRGTDPTDLARIVTGTSFAPTDRPRMAPIDRLRGLTVRQSVPSHPRRSARVHRRT